MTESLPQVYLARHGETAWTISRQHTGRTDIPLTARGEANARSLGERLKAEMFELVFVSPLSRARRTCELAGFGTQARPEPDLLEWNYGADEGRTTAQIRAERPGWYLFRDGCPGGESIEAVGARADRVVARLKRASGRVILFGHGHFFRVPAARWLGLPTAEARHFWLGTAALCVLGYEHTLDEPAILLWNDDRHATL
jgi:broad specificity phosphatase PhoE